MPPQFVTPSSHRFLTPNKRQGRGHPPSSSQSRVGASSTADISSHAETQKFAQIPKFSFGARKSKHVIGNATDAPSSLRRELQTERPWREDVDKALRSREGEEDEDDEGDQDEDMLDKGPVDEGYIDVAAEPGSEAPVASNQRTGPKRRRLSPPAVPPESDLTQEIPRTGVGRVANVSQSQSYGFETPHLAKRPPFTHHNQSPPRTVPRFLFPTQSPASLHRPPSFSLPPTSTARSSPAPFTSTRPSFILPPAAPPASDAHSPVPEVFSPHRKGQKFLPGGMAAEVREWIVEAGQQAVAGRRGMYSREREEGTVMRVVVRDVSGGNDADGNVRFVRGMKREGVGGGMREEEKRYLLVGTGKGGRGTKDGVKRGDVLGIWAPVWEVDLEGDRWVVGVDWGVVGVERLGVP